MFAVAPAGYYASWLNVIDSLTANQTNFNFTEHVINLAKTKYGWKQEEGKKLRAIITVNPGITISSTDPSTPAVLISGKTSDGEPLLRTFDTLILINKGNIYGAGGYGGLGGTGSGSIDSIKNGSAGGRGGTAIKAEQRTIVINNGEIKGGGGGGGGGGGNAVYTGLVPNGTTNGPWCTIDAWYTANCGVSLPTSVAPCGHAPAWYNPGTGNDCPCQIKGECKQYERVCADYEWRCVERKRGKCINRDKVCVKYKDGNCLRWGCVNDQRNCSCGQKTQRGEVVPCVTDKNGACCAGQPARCGTQCRGIVYLHNCKPNYTGNIGGTGGKGGSFNVSGGLGGAAASGAGKGGNGGNLGMPGEAGVGITNSNSGAGGLAGYYIEGQSLVNITNTGTILGNII